MTPLETNSSLRVKIGYLETRNAYEHYDLTSQVEALQKQVERLEAELADRPVVYIDVIDGKRRESSTGIPVLYTRKEIETCLSSLDFRPYKGDISNDTA